jgi:hypothetical protein
MEAHQKALKRMEGAEKTHLNHHSVRGCQYASKEYISVLKQYGIRISMTGSGEAKENAQAERINNTMKNELLKDVVFHNEDEVKAAVSIAVDFYNKERPYMRIDKITPREAAGSRGELAKRWTSHRLIVIKSRQESPAIAEKDIGLPTFAGSPSGLRPSSQPLDWISCKE